MLAPENEWSAAKVARWVRDVLQLPHCASLFKQRNVPLSLLLGLTEEDLAGLGITSVCRARPTRFHTLTHQSISAVPCRAASPIRNSLLAALIYDFSRSRYQSTIQQLSCFDSSLTCTSRLLVLFNSKQIRRRL
jgi:hypothetical protein